METVMNSCYPFCPHRKARLIKSTVLANSIPLTAKPIQERLFSWRDLFLSSIWTVSDPRINDSQDILESGVPAKNPPELRRIYFYFFDNSHFVLF